MSAMRVLLCLLLSAATVSAAELKTLKGETIKGEVVELTEKEIVIESDGKKVATPVDQVLTLTFTDEYVKLGVEDKFILVELTDGSQLKCANVALKGKDIVLQTLQAQKVTMPLAKVNWILNEAHDAKNLQAFREKVLGRKKARDILAIKNEDVVNTIEGTIGDADEKGENIEFVLPDGRKRPVPISRPLALYFQRGADAMAKPVICRLNDIHRNLLYVSELKREADGYTLVTSAGATLKYTSKQVARLDYSTGKLAYLSDLTPASVKETSTEQTIYRHRKDENLDGGKIRLGGVEYKRGLPLHATTEMEFDLEGEYRELKAVVGIDDEVGGSEEPTILKIYGDEVELLNWTVSRKDKQKVRNLALNVKDVRRLKIVVTTGDILDLGKHLTLADARVSK